MILATGGADSLIKIFEDNVNWANLHLNEMHYLNFNS